MIALLLATNSCMTGLLIYEYGIIDNMLMEQKMTDISKTKTKLKLRIIQTITPNEGLASTPEYDVVKVQTITEKLYDGKQMKGTFILVDTYTYTTINGVIKTIPVFVPAQELKKYKKASRYPVLKNGHY